MKTWIVILMTFAVPAWAQTFVGTFVVVHGDVKILRPPAANDPGPFAQLEGVKYSYEAAKIGKKVNPGEVIQSGTDGKAKIAYPNGDSFLVGNATSLVMPSVTDKSEQGTSAIKLIYGRMRSLISKSGPRNNMKVSTPSVVAGVRGTDFFTRANPDVGTQLTVLRGEVSVASTAKPEVSVAVKTGYSIEASSKSKEAPKAIEATKEDLRGLQKESEVKATKEDLAKLSAEEKKQVSELNEKTKVAVIQDIKSYNPRLGAELEKKHLSDDELNSAVVDKLVRIAPAAQKKKMSKADADAAGQGVYEKYYDDKASKEKTK